MIDAAAVFAGSLASALFLLAVALLRNRLTGMRDRLRRTAKAVRVEWSQMDERDRRVIRWGGRVLWVELLIVAAIL
jgi:type II secretory pathway component PulM